MCPTRLDHAQPTPVDRYVELAEDVRNDLQGLVAPQPWQSVLLRPRLPWGSLSPSFQRKNKKYLHIACPVGSPTAFAPIPVVPEGIIFENQHTRIEKVTVLSGGSKALTAVLKTAQPGSEIGVGMLQVEKTIAAHVIATELLPPLVQPLAICTEGIVYEFISDNQGKPAPTLQQKLRQRDIDISTWKNVMTMIARAMQLLHAHELSYLDLKADHILIDGNGQGRLIDLGSIRRYGDLIDPHEGLITNSQTYNPAEIIETQRLIAAQDVPDKKAFGLVIAQSLNYFPDSRQKRWLSLLAEHLIDAVKHPFPMTSVSELGEFRDAYHFSWDMIIQALNHTPTTRGAIKETLISPKRPDPRRD